MFAWDAFEDEPSARSKECGAVEAAGKGDISGLERR
jgi:hypothetical protein